MTRKKISAVLLRASHKLGVVAKKIYSSPMEKRVVPWLECKGDKTLRLNYDLNPDSVVFDVGGYEGQWASDIFARYGCAIHVFEPVDAFAREIEQRFNRNPKIKVHRFGLASSSQRAQVSMSDDGTSLYGAQAATIDIELIEAAPFFERNQIERIDLMKINIEGAEYDLIEYLIDRDLMRKIVNLQVQFHDFAPQAEARMKRIQERLKATHHLTYQFLFVWENWGLNQPENE